MSEPRVFSANLLGSGRKFAIVVARFNDFITQRLCDGAVDTLARHGVERTDIDIAWVPGAFDLPLVASTMAKTKRYDAVIALGAVIRGATPHFDYVSAHVARGVGQASLETQVPISFGVLTTNSIEQAIERAGTKAGNKGGDAALAALEMAGLMQSLKEVH